MRYYKIVNNMKYNNSLIFYEEDKKLSIQSNDGQEFPTKFGIVKQKLNYTSCPCEVHRILDAYNLYKEISNANIYKSEYILEIEGIEPNKYKDEFFIPKLNKNSVVAVYKKHLDRIEVFYRKEDRKDVSMVEDIELGLSEEKFYEVSGWKGLDLRSSVKENLMNLNTKIHITVKDMFDQMTPETEDINIVDFIQRME